MGPLNMTQACLLLGVVLTWYWRCAYFAGRLARQSQMELV